MTKKKSALIKDHNPYKAHGPSDGSTSVLMECRGILKSSLQIFSKNSMKEESVLRELGGGGHTFFVRRVMGETYLTTG